MKNDYLPPATKKRSFISMTTALIVGSWIAMGCQSQKAAMSAPPVQNAAEGNLTQGEAEARSLQVGNVRYRLSIGLNAGADEFTGDETIGFDLKTPTAHGLFLDFQNGAQISKLQLNGADLPLTAFMRHRIALPDAGVKSGANTVAITYRQAYSRVGRGLHRFEDPEDHKIYLHSQFEAFDAHQMFPCFDQPDIKAVFRLHVAAPKDWQVVSATREDGIKAAGAVREWSFPDSAKMSTYLFSLHAGPYKVWTSKAGDIPLRLFARQTLARYVQPEDWFKPTREGLAFYGEYFSYKYPFKKYDELIVPDFNAGAMENVAAITFTEYFIKRGHETRDDRESTASVILHEMAHQWFGDLVTMKWWNGLWLNESFATYMSALAMSRATEFKESWQEFFVHEKAWAYNEDQLVTTHPIDGSVPDTSSAFANFDGITYGKGASVLKQLSASLGDTAFRAGLRGYFAQNAYQNTTLQDFIAALQTASPHRHLKSWAETWLTMAGLDSVRARYTCSGGADKSGSIVNFSLLLKGPDGQPSPREHKTRVALYKKTGMHLAPGKTVDVTYSGPETQVPDLVGEPCPALVDSNAADEDYVKMLLDAPTFAEARTNIGMVEPDLTRERLWTSLYQMLRDNEYLPQDYLNLVDTSFGAEKNLVIGTLIMRSLPQVTYYVPESDDREKTAKQAALEKLEDVLWAKAQKSPAGSDWQLEAFDGFLRTVQTLKGEDHLVRLMKGESSLQGLHLDQDRRWDVIQRLNALNDPQATELLDSEKKRDTSERGVQMAMAAEASRPMLNVKQEWVDRTMNDAKMSFSRKRTVMTRFLPVWQNNIRTELAARYYKTLPVLAQNSDEGYLNLFATSLMPTTCSEESAKSLEVFAGDHRDTFPLGVMRRLRQGIQEDRRCASIRNDAAVGKASATPELW